MDDFRGYPHDLGNLYDLLWSVIHSCMCMQILLGRINTADSLVDSLLSTSAALRWVYFTLVGIQVTFRGSVLTHGKFTLLSFSYLCCSIVSVSTCFLHSIPIILDVRLFVFFFQVFVCQQISQHLLLAPTPCLWSPKDVFRTLGPWAFDADPDKNCG